MAPRTSAQRSKEHREKVKEDPEKYQLYLKKEKERYKRRKEEGKLKAISQRSKKEQKQQRKKWGVNQRNKRVEDKIRQEAQHHIDANTPPGSPELQVGLLNLQVQQNETPVLVCCKVRQRHIPWNCSRCG